MAQSEVEALRDKILADRHREARKGEIAAARKAHAEHQASITETPAALQADCEKAHAEFAEASRSLVTSPDRGAAMARYQAAGAGVMTAQHRLANHIRTRPKAARAG